MKEEAIDLNNSVDYKCNVPILSILGQKTNIKKQCRAKNVEKSLKGPCKVLEFCN